MSTLRDKIRDGTHNRRLEANQRRRAAAVAELTAARHELGVLVRAAKNDGMPMTHIARAAGVRRERCYDLLSGVDRKHPDIYANEEETP